MQYYYGCVILEGLLQADFLSSYQPIAVKVADMPDDPDATTWHIHWYRVNELELAELLPQLAEATLPHWYAHFFNEDELHVALAGKAFRASTQDKTTWEEFIRYGERVGIERRWTENLATALPGWVDRGTVLRPPGKS